MDEMCACVRFGLVTVCFIRIGVYTFLYVNFWFSLHANELSHQTAKVALTALCPVSIDPQQLKGSRPIRLKRDGPRNLHLQRRRYFHGG